MFEEIQEANDELKQLNDAMSQPFGAAAEIDEDDLANELNELEGQVQKKDTAQYCVYVPTYVCVQPIIYGSG